MNFLKSVFISNYMMLTMGLAGYAGWMIYQGDNLYGWAGVFLTTAPLLMMLGRLMMFKSVARTSAHFPVLNLLGLIGVGLSSWAWINQQMGILPFVLALVGWIGFIFYAYWFSSFGGRKASQMLKTGTPLPAFMVTNTRGESVSSTQLTNKPAILIFFRGNWCPLCMAQIKELVARYKEISALGVRVAFISPQPRKNTENLAKKFGVHFEFFTDSGNLAARKLGIAQKHGLPMGMQMMGYQSETVLPTVMITNEDGHIIWTHETDNYRIRPEPDTYLKVLRQHNIAPA